MDLAPKLQIVHHCANRKSNILSAYLCLCQHDNGKTQRILIRTNCDVDFTPKLQVRMTFRTKFLHQKSVSLYDLFLRKTTWMNRLFLSNYMSNSLTLCYTRSQKELFDALNECNSCKNRHIGSKIFTETGEFLLQ